jgi:short-subunit dehydrogenase
MTKASAQSPSRPRQTALITGASTGIGYELAKIFAAEQYDLVLVARNEERLHAVKKELEARNGISARVLAADLADPAAPATIHDLLQREGVQIDVLVNNAGFGQYGDFHRGDLRRYLDMVQVNITALVHLTGLFLPGMVARRKGRVLNVASTAGFQPGPLMAVYYATKAMVVSFSNAIHAELAGTGVTVTTLCPGPTRTEFHVRAETGRSRLFRGPMMMKADAVARAGYDAMQRGKMVVIPGAVNNMLMFSATRLLPRAWVTRMVRVLQRHDR